MITSPKAKQKKKRRGREGTISLNLEHMFWKSNLHMESGGALAEGAGAEDLLVNSGPLPWRPS